MAPRTINLDDRVYDYLIAHSLRELPVLAALRAETAKLPQAGMQISPEQGQFSFPSPCRPAAAGQQVSNPERCQTKCLRFPATA